MNTLGLMGVTTGAVQVIVSTGGGVTPPVTLMLTGTVRGEFPGLVASVPVMVTVAVRSPAVVRLAVTMPTVSVEDVRPVAGVTTHHG